MYGTECGACGISMEAVEGGYIWEGGAACDAECLGAQS